MSKLFYFNPSQFSTRTMFSSSWPIDRTLSGTTTLGQSGPGSNGNKGVLRITQSYFVQSPGAGEYTYFFSAEGKPHPNECLRYDIKHSDGEVPVILNCLK